MWSLFIDGKCWMQIHKVVNAGTSFIFYFYSFEGSAGKTNSKFVKSENQKIGLKLFRLALQVDYAWLLLCSQLNKWCLYTVAEPSSYTKDIE